MEKHLLFKSFSVLTIKQQKNHFEIKNISKEISKK